MKSLHYLPAQLMTLALLAFSTVTRAEHIVEVVVFSQPGAPVVAGAPPDHDWDRNAVSLQDTTRQDVRRIDKSRYTLDSQAEKLAANGYDIKLHQAWIQPADAGMTVAVHSDTNIPTINQGLTYPVQGLVTIKDEPLTAAVSFWLNKVNGDQGELISERLHMTRRLRLNEIHYLDHKSMGMLIQISRP